MNLPYKLETAEAPKRERFLNSGLLLVDKPAGITSMDVLRVVKRLCRPKKVGHGGTLDPFATGLLPVLMNSATKMSDTIISGVKEYEGSFVLGLSFDTQDITGKPLGEPRPLPENLSLEMIQKKANEFLGEVEQVPPMYSAIKKNGKPLYSYARKGESVEVSSRKVHIEEFKILGQDAEIRFRFRVRVHKGTYVRTLIHDLGESLGCGAVLESLRRTQIGPFSIDEAVQLSTLKFASDISEKLKTITETNRRIVP